MIRKPWIYESWTRHLVTILIIFIAFLVRKELLPFLGRDLPYVTFYPATTFSALFGGFSAGITAIIASVLIVIVWVLGINQPVSSYELLLTATFILSCLAISYAWKLIYCARVNEQAKSSQFAALNKQLTQQKQMYQTLIKNLPDKIARFDKQLQIIYTKPDMEQEGGQKAAEVMGKTLREPGIPPEMYEPILSRIKTVFETKQTIEYESVYVSQYGTKYYHNIIVPEFQNGFTHTVLVVTRDLTLQKQAEKELARFDQLNIIGNMAASIGHEIRNPLTTVRGYLQLFGMKKEYAEHKEQFDTMLEELDRANSIITEFLSLSKNKYTEFECGNLNDIIHALAPLLKAEASLTGHTITIELSDIADINMDKQEIKQILLNLVRNGVEATPPGGTITIKTSIIDSHVFLSVQDTGHGIPKDILDKLGMPFVTTKDTGTGLGLPVCYRIADRHHAKIEVETSSIGTTFFVRFNRAASEESKNLS